MTETDRLLFGGAGLLLSILGLRGVGFLEKVSFGTSYQSIPNFSTHLSTHDNNHATINTIQTSH